jgi:hypothetical protein
MEINRQTHNWCVDNLITDHHKEIEQQDDFSDLLTT